NNSGLMVNNADVTSDDAAALHVDKNTVMEKPITLTDSTLTGPTAIKLDNAATVLQYRLERRAKYVCRGFRTGARPQQS
ncbi:hypothetical protein, partial [Salmonella enterica]|uniref:hypothetical protein n=1 Tax=Salmonella enterica TaxID=28901 RepID=UPI000A49F071